jgi:hypothetical protein
MYVPWGTGLGIYTFAPEDNTSPSTYIPCPCPLGHGMNGRQSHSTLAKNGGWL